MAITNGSTATSDDFIDESERDATPANDAGKSIKLESDGRISPKFLNAAIATGTSSPLSVTTDGYEKLLVIAKGTMFYDQGDNVQITLTLAYNGVTKDQVTVQAEVDNLDLRMPFMLMYTETPTAGTRDITVTANNGTIQNLVIIAIKL